MKKELMSEVLLKELKNKYEIEKKEVLYPVLKKNAMTFYLDVYEVKDLGHLCVLRMKAILGLMKMESITFVVNEKDVPLLNFDYIKAMGNETLLVEFYDNMLEALKPEFFTEFNQMKEELKYLKEYECEPNWYDDILYDITLHKTGKKCSEKFKEISLKYLNTFITKMDSFPLCDKEKKNEKIYGFANTLFVNGGPAVNAFKELFGDKITKKVVIEYMYGQKIEE